MRTSCFEYEISLAVLQGLAFSLIRYFSHSFRSGSLLRRKSTTSIFWVKQKKILIGLPKSLFAPC